MKIKIVFFSTMFKHRPTGVNNLILDIIEYMDLSNKFEIVILGNKEFHFDIIKKLENKKNIKIIIDKKINLFIGGFYINFFYKKFKFDYILGPAGVLPPFINKKIKKILFIHDFVYKEYPETMSKKIKLIMNILGDLSIKKSKIIWTNSKYTMSRAEKYFCLSDKLKFIGTAVNKKIYRKLDLTIAQKKELKKKYEIIEKSILFVGTLEPRKNIDYLISLMPELEKSGYQLLVVGGKGWGNTRIREQIEELNLKKETIKFLDYISTTEIVILYNIVDIYISTSKNEGFGLPQLEAMSCGCPVVTAHNSAMIEIAENGAETIEGWNKFDWIERIKKVYQNKEFYEKRSFAKSKEYDWKKIIDELYDKIKL